MNIEKMKDHIETNRLVLCPYTKENLSLFNTDLLRFEEEYGVVYQGEELDHLLKSFLIRLEKEIEEDPGHYLFFTEFLIVLKETGHVIGSIDYKYVPKDGVTEVGYGMNPEYEGHGYMTETLEAFLGFGRTLGIRTVLADTEPGNRKSQNVLRRCGFRYLKEDGNIWWTIDLNREGNDMNEITKRLIDANRKYRETGTFTGDVSAQRRIENASGQKPYAVVVTCSDSRVIPEVIFDAGIGELFVVRTAGNVIGDAEYASILYAVEHLHTDTVIVMGHTGCGAVNAALHGEFEGPVGVITLRIKKAIGEERDPYQACVLNVKYGVGSLKERLNGSGVAIRGAVYDIVSGEVGFLD